MPELPDVESFRRYINSTALHQKIDNVDARDDRLITGTSKSALTRKLRGHELAQTTRHGKYLGIETDAGDWLILHFGMTGDVAYYKDGGKEPDYTKLRLDFANGYHLAYTNARRLGRISLTTDFGDFIEQEDLGPDALEIDRDGFVEMLRGGHGALKSRLMNQNLIAGIGNVYVDELLYQVGVHPAVHVDDLSDEQRKELYRAMRRILRTASRHFGEPEKLPDDWLLPHRGTDGKCPRGHGKLKNIKVGGRTTYFCPKCQPRRG